MNLRTAETESTLVVAGRETVAEGVVASEWPPGRTPTRMRFLVRNRVIAALTTGTVVVEAAQRSGALNTARHAREVALSRALGAGENGIPYRRRKLAWPSAPRIGV